MRLPSILIALLTSTCLCASADLQQQYEKAYFLETAKGQARQAAAIYKTISEAEPTPENKEAIKLSLMRLLAMAVEHKNEGVIQECHAKLLQKTGATIQELVESTEAGGTVYIPEGRYEGAIVIGKPLTLKGADRKTAILELTSDQPLIYAPSKTKVTIQSLTLTSQLETSERRDPPGCTLVARDATATVIDCDFTALGNFKRSPCAVLPIGFSTVRLEGCRFEGYEYPIQYADGAQGTVKNCVIRNPGHCGITVGNDCEVEVTGNIVTGSRFHGVRCTGGTLVVKDNLIVRNRNRGIYLGNRSAQGEISNNAIVGNGTGISSFASTEVEIRNNILVDNTHSGIDTRGTCRITVENNIFSGNKSGFVVYDGGDKLFRLKKNTFWNNGTATTDFELPNTTLEVDPKFKAPAEGSFFVGQAKVKSAKQGLTDPDLIVALWRSFSDTSR